MLEQAPAALIASNFPLGTHARRHVGILHVQAMLRRRSEAMCNVAAQATHRLANEQAKARKAKKGKGLTDSEGEDDDKEALQCNCVHASIQNGLHTA